MTAAFSPASQFINITLGLPSQRGGAGGDRGVGGGGTLSKMGLARLAAHHSDQKLSCLTHRGSKKCTHSKINISFWASIAHQSQRENCSYQTKPIRSIDTDSPHCPISGTKPPPVYMSARPEVVNHGETIAEG